MKTWEMIKELTENPEKEFKRVGDELKVSVDIDDSLLWKSGHSPFNINNEWEEVKKPVDFMELLFKVEKNGDFSDVDFKYKDKGFEDCNLYYILRSLADRCEDDRELARCILIGKWYIED